LPRTKIFFPRYIVDAGHLTFSAKKMEENLQRLYGVGPVLAKAIVQRLVAAGLVQSAADSKTYTQLRRILKRGEIFRNLPAATQADLIYSPIKEIPRRVITILDHELHKFWHETTLEIAGSYRRGKPVSRDVDVVINRAEPGDLTTVVRLMSRVNDASSRVYFHTPFAMGPEKAAIMVDVVDSGRAGKKYTVKVDIFVTDPEEYIFALLFATGSGLFNVRMRALAKRRGMLLNHKGLFKLSPRGKLQRLNIKTEEEIFKILNMRYRRPEDRVT
jgi:DNA polymerase/3'-5' exonuclease PolX